MENIIFGINFQIITLPITIPGTKPGEQPQQQTIQIQVVNPNNVANSEKMVPLSLQHFPVLQLAYNHQTQDGIQLQVVLYFSAFFYFLILLSC